MLVANHVIDFSAPTSLAILSLFQPSFNFTLTEDYDKGKKGIVQRPTDQSFNSSGPRLWLDDEGFVERGMGVV
jgi:hypothetical protein